MKTVIVALLAAFLFVPLALADPTGDVTQPIHQAIDGFNTGDVRSAYAAYATDSVTIIDEFAPHHWTGPKAMQAWAADYDKHAAATGVTTAR